MQLSDSLVVVSRQVFRGRWLQSGPGQYPAGKATPHLNRRSERHRCLAALLIGLLLAFGTGLAAAQGTLTNGWTHTGIIAPVGDADTWTFYATNGDRLVIRVGEISQTNAFSPRVRLQNPNAVLVAQATAATAPEVTFTATNTGLYTVIVSDNLGTTATGTYRITLAQAPGEIFVAPGDEGGPMTNGVAHQGNLPAGDLDVWSFNANAGDSLVVRIGQISQTNNFDPWVRLYGPNGVLLGSAADVDAAEVATRATNSGTFLVVVANDPYYTDAASGTYMLTLAKTGDPIVLTAGRQGGPLTNGVANVSDLPVGGLDLWSFTANAGDSLVLRAGQVTDPGNNFDPWVRLYGPDGALLGSIQAASAPEVTLRATNSGTFLVVMANYPYYSDAAYGTYRLTLAKTGVPIVLPPGHSGGPLTNGAGVVSALAVGGLDLWNFNANAGDSIILRAGQVADPGNNFDPWIRLYGPDGALLGSIQAASAPEVTLRATNSGTFLVVMANYPYYSDAAYGTYRLTLAKTGDPVVVLLGEEGGPLTNGLSHLGDLPLGGLDLWTFTASPGDAIVLRAGQITDPGNNFDPWIRLYGPSGALIASDAAVAAAEVALRATNSGSFLAVIANDPYYSDTATGSYLLTLAKTGAPLAISPSDEGGSLTGAGVYSGTIGVGDVDSWTFTSCSGDLISVSAAQVLETNAFAPWVRIYGPTGLLVGSSFGALTGAVSIRATNSGTFLLVLANNDYYNNAGSGTYQMTVNGLSDGLKLCLPTVAGTNLNLVGIGGVANGSYVLLTQTNVATSLSDWSPILTNQFDAFGLLRFTNYFDRTERSRYFRLDEQ